MKICNRPQPATKKEFIAGHLYKGCTGAIYIATGEGTEKISLVDGFKGISSFLGGGFVDVTDQYCLQQVG